MSSNSNTSIAQAHQALRREQAEYHCEACCAYLEDSQEVADHVATPGHQTRESLLRYKNRVVNPNIEAITRIVRNPAPRPPPSQNRFRNQGRARWWDPSS